MSKKANKILSSVVVLGMLLGTACNVKTNETELSAGSGPESVSQTSISETSAGSDTEGGDFTGLYASSVLDTGNLTEQGSGYEGIEGTGNYNYGEALQKSILFYELQRSGDLPDQVRCNWRGDSGLTDGADNNIDLTGGLYDAGDHVKFNLPMAYTASVLSWSVYEFGSAYEQAGQMEYIKGDIRWITDYLIKCHPEDEVFYYQVGDGGTDHSWWGPAEVMAMSRPSYKVTRENPGSAVTAESAAALAAAAVIFKDTDQGYSELCLEHARSLFKFANDTRSDAGYTAANGFYDSHSGFYDELAWAGVWLYIATGEDEYLDIAESCYAQASSDYIWAMCWDDVHIGAAVLLARITDKDIYSNAVEKHLDWWTTGTEGERITYTPKGLAWLDSWGSLRYSTTTAFVAAVYASWQGCDKDRVSTYLSFAEAQCDYALGSSGRSYMVGFGENPPCHPHHRTAQGSYCDNMNEPASHRHTLYGALVGGPDANDGYTDEVSNYNTNEVACDYNAGFTGLLAYMYSRYHGMTLKDFGAVEIVDSYEYTVEASINASGDDFTEIKAILMNQTAWPARGAQDVELRYFVDLSEVSDPKVIEITSNYMSCGAVDGLKVWDEDNGIYYLSVVFNDGMPYPGGQSQYKGEVQVRLRNPGGPWDPSNDPSYAGMSVGSQVLNENIAVYEGGVLVFGSEPASGSNAGQSVVLSETSAQPQQTEQSQPNNNGGQGESGDLAVSVRYDSQGSNANSISAVMEITNTSDSAISFADLDILYYITNERGAPLSFECYYSGMTEANGMYSQVTGITGSFGDCQGQDCDTCLTVSMPDSGAINAGAQVTVNFAIHYADWQPLDSTDDYSCMDPQHIVITSGGDVIYGTKP